MKTYNIKLYVYNRGSKNGKAFGVNMKRGYWLELTRTFANTNEATAWIDDIHLSGLLWIAEWKIEEVA